MFGVSHGALQFMTYEEMKNRYNEYRNLPIDIKLVSSTLSYIARLHHTFRVLDERVLGQRDSVNNILVNQYEKITTLWCFFYKYFCLTELSSSSTTCLSSKTRYLNSIIHQIKQRKLYIFIHPQ